MSNNLTVDNSNKKNRVSYSKNYIYYAAWVFGMANLLDIFSSNAVPLIKSFVIDEFFLQRGIAENIAYGNPNANRAQITKAARDAELEEVPNAKKRLDQLGAGG